MNTTCLFKYGCVTLHRRTTVYTNQYSTNPSLMQICQECFFTVVVTLALVSQLFEARCQVCYNNDE